MNILIISHLYYPKIGGVEIAVANLSEQFVKKGHRVEIVTTHNPRTSPKSELINGIKVTRLPFRMPKYNPVAFLKFLVRATECIIKLLFIIKEKKYDVINLHYIGENALYALFLSYIRQIPLVTSIHGSDIEYFTHKGRFNKWVVKKTLNKSKKIIANSNALLKVTSSMFGTSILRKSTVIGNGVDVALIQHIQQSENNIAGATPYILGIGRLEHFKGFDILIDAFAIVKQKLHDVKLMIIGDGPERATLELKSNKLALEDSILFYGRIEQREVMQAIVDCKFVIMSSRREAFGIVILEAMASGKAVIAADVGGVSELVNHGKNGLLVKDHNPESFATEIIFLLEHPKIAAQFGIEGRQMVSSRYTWEIIGRKYLEIYNTVYAK